MLQAEEIMVNSRHNYHITSSGIHVASALAEDGVIEAIESTNKKFHLGVQWHPELLPKEETLVKITSPKRKPLKKSNFAFLMEDTK